MTVPSTLPAHADLPDFLQPLASRAAHGDGVLVDRPARAPLPAGALVRESAVLLLIAGTSPRSARIVLQERGHRMRSQPGQFGLPGGGREPGDGTAIATALREAREEIGLDAAAAHVLGAFAPVAMPHRGQQVVPVLAWARDLPTVGVVDPIEVERVVWADVQGPGSFTDPDARFAGRLDGRDVGIGFDLPDDVLVWGFTAALIDAAVRGMGFAPAAPATTREIPAARRR